MKIFRIFTLLTAILVAQVATFAHADRVKDLSLIHI